MRVAKFFWISVFILNPIIPLILFFYITDIRPSPLVVLFYGFGIFGFTWFTNEIIISARPKFIERIFGLDKLLLFHIFSSIIALAAGLLHTALLDSVQRWNPSLGREIGSITQGLAIGLFSISAIFFTTIFTDLHPLLSKLRRWLLHSILRLDFQIIRIIHNLFVVIIVGFLLHILFTTTLEEYPQARWIFIVQVIISIIFYLYNKVFKLVLPKYRYFVEKVIEDSENTVTIELSPKFSGKIYSYIPGQFVFVRFITNSRLMEEHPFSISSSPLNKKTLSITVKRLGNYTSALRDLKPGTKAIVDYPFGSFSIPESLNRDKIVLIAGGIGITPFLGYLSYLSEKNKDQKVTLIWGIRNPEDLLKKDFFDDIKKIMPDFQLIPIISNLKNR